MNTKESALERSALMLGEDAISYLNTKTIMICGLGGVGSAAAEALGRIGIGRIHLVDDDVIKPSNLNRQLIALTSTIGKSKVAAAAERISDMGTGSIGLPHKLFIEEGSLLSLPIGYCDYVIDAIDTISSKLALIKEAQRLSCPIISCMGTGNKTDAGLFEIKPIEHTGVCPLARVVRKEVKKRGLLSFPALFSTEAPKNTVIRQSGRHAPGSLSFVPPVAGMLIAGYVIRALLAQSTHHQDH